MARKFLMVFLSLGLFVSCTHAPIQKQQQTSNAVNGMVIDRDALVQGGDLALIPFRAGPLPEANDELDQISMAALRGIKESMDAEKSSLRVIAQGEGQPQIALQGYVREFSKTGRLKRMMMRPNRYLLALEGELWLVSTGRRLMSFSVQRTFYPKKEKLTDVAFAMGQDISRFIAEYTR